MPQANKSTIFDILISENKRQRIQSFRVRENLKMANIPKVYGEQFNHFMRIPLNTRANDKRIALF